MTPFSDYFSTTAPGYARFRPRYPDHLFGWLAGQAPSRDRAWDCGTGTGQAAHPLALRFAEVLATDPSEAQVRQAHPRANIRYAVMTAERSALRSQSVSLVTVAQALHWFDLEMFYPEVRRVLQRGGVLAIWTYGLCTLGDPELDRRLGDFYRNEIGPWWPAERALVDAGYRSLPFPFDELAAPAFEMSADWTLEQFAGYIGTWSAVTRYRSATGSDPVPAFAEALASHWGPAASTRRVAWPLELRAGRT